MTDRTKWTDERLDDRFAQLDKAVQNVDQAADRINGAMITFLTATIIALVGLLGTILVISGAIG